MTFMHDAFILEALKSIDIQETNFYFEVVIGDDFSTDKTLEIIKNYEFQNANIKVVILNRQKGDDYSIKRERLGRIYNFINILDNCKGKYVALLDGDDYWVDPLKLQKQVDFLEANPEYEVCFTNICIVDENDSITKQALITDNRKTDYKRKDLPIWAPTLTRVFKNRDFSTVPSAPGLDTVMLLWQSQFGKIKFINEVSGAYRKHQGGIYSAISKVKQKEHQLTTLLVSLSIIEANLYAKYFGMLFKQLIEIKTLDKLFYKKNKQLIQDAFVKYNTQMSFKLRLSIHFAFVLASLPVNYKQLTIKKYCFKVLDHMFIY